MNDNIIEHLQNWYQSKCDGMWEHEYGFDISTLDNPGWKVNISGENGKNPLNIIVNNTDDDWVNIKASEREFKGYGGIANLETILKYAAQWLDKV
ncbi:hypothetical protein TI10_15330 [Photorhabdus luminescens subsp. luminescens]|uniref:Immunity protein 53 n=2 Tax=Photorhabdus TaxID=29487 RepID=A0ABX0B074_9GAMM|nr:MULTISPECIES: Imm53 family immunity protein [Photorhabdus]KMW72334.1 hypothetical protein TI10_15330 [Photorhabdus luminescens subsp. luminescens]MCC8375376.1 immunity 53 family protein [Photorhabdus bodei]NDL12959.1 hypothetical protein [Photorhabdus kayaii]NDL12967.1 hypothetical protein [Photorhabdus kayaii]NDL26484.1 hypothetical protein [Photorhabdus kayaii]